MSEGLGSNSMTNVLKELTDDILTVKDRLGMGAGYMWVFIEFNCDKYDSCMEDFDRRIARYDEESQRFLDEVDEIGT